MSKRVEIVLTNGYRGHFDFDNRKEAAWVYGEITKNLGTDNKVGVQSKTGLHTILCKDIFVVSLK